MGGGGQRKQPTRAEGRDDNDDTIVGSNGFVHCLKLQSTNEGGTRGEMVMKWVKKEEERTTIEGRGHDDNNQIDHRRGGEDGGDDSADDDTMTTKTTTMKPRSDRSCGGGEWRAAATAVAVVTRG